MVETGVDLDLDALEPEKVNINYKGKVIAVTPPNLKLYAQLLGVSVEMSKAQKTDNPSDIMPLYDKINDLIVKAIPAFKDVNLNPQQILAIYTLLIELSTPKDKVINELKAKGVDQQGGKGDPKA